jgi:hypothetical protein
MADNIDINVTPITRSVTIEVSNGATVSDVVYGVAWDGDTTNAPSKNALYDKIESIIAGVGTGATPETFTAVGGETSWVVTTAITSSHKFFVNGVKLVEGTDYTQTGSTFTFTGYTSVAGHEWEYYPDIAVPANGLLSTDIDTLAELNAIVTDATLIDTNDPRLSDARTPTAHTHTASEITDFDTEVSNNASVVANTAKVTYPSADSTKVGFISVTQAVDLDTMESNIATNNAKVGVTTQISNLSEDTTPQLGGELDLNGHSVGGDAQTATGDGTTTIDWSLGNFFHFQFGAFNEVFTFTAPTKAGTFILKLVQDSVGSRTVTFPATVKWSGGTAPTLTTTATTGTDIITFYFDGTNYFGVEVLNFS